MQKTFVTTFKLLKFFQSVSFPFTIILKRREWCTVVAMIIHNLIKQVLLKWGNFDGAKPILKLLPVSWSYSISLWRFRYFYNWDAISFCRSKGCTVVVCQTLRLILLSGTGTWPVRTLQIYFQISNINSLQLYFFWKDPHLLETYALASFSIRFLLSQSTVVGAAILTNFWILNLWFLSKL